MPPLALCIYKAIYDVGRHAVLIKKKQVYYNTYIYLYQIANVYRKKSHRMRARAQSCLFALLLLAAAAGVRWPLVARSTHADCRYQFLCKKKKSILKCVVLAAHPYEAYKEKTGITQNIRTFQVVCIRQNDQHDDNDAPAPTTIFFYVCV